MKKLTKIEKKKLIEKAHRLLDRLDQVTDNMFESLKKLKKDDS